MPKTIILVGTVAGVTLAMILLIASLALLEYDAIEEDLNSASKSDVIVPTKASRPGCQDLDNCYIPSQITVDSGEEVIWVNEDSAFHSVTSGSYDAPAELFDSGYLDPAESYTLTFDRAGTFDYFCTLHPWMQGQVIVK